MLNRLIHLINESIQEYSRTVLSNEDVVEDLAERLIKKGVIVPPCTYKDKIYVIPSKVNFDLNILHNLQKNNRVYEQTVDEIRIYPTDYMIFTCEGLCNVVGSMYKQTWFLSKTEADTALQKLGAEYEKL